MPMDRARQSDFGKGKVETVWRGQGSTVPPGREREAAMG